MSVVANTSATPARPLGIGILGCADIALRRFLPAAARSAVTRLVAVADRDMSKASSIARQFDCDAMDFRDLLRTEQIDLVYIPLPNHLHEEWTIEAVRHGKHVLCEKPLTINADSARRMLSEAENSGLLVFENIMYLQHPQHNEVKEVLASGRIGTVTRLNCVFTIPDLEPGNFRSDPQQGGGAFHDLNRYPLSAAQYFLKGDIDAIVRCESEWRNGMVFAMEAEARTTADESFTFTIAFGQPYRCFYEIYGSDGMLRLERAFTTPADHEAQLEIYSRNHTELKSMSVCDHFLTTIEYVAALISSGSSFAPHHARTFALAQTADRFVRYAEEAKERT